MADFAAAGFDARRGIRIQEVQRDLNVYFVRLVDTLEVDVQHLLPVGVPLRIAQQHRLLGAVDVQRQYGGVEGFLAQRVVQRIVIQFDLQRGGSATVDDAGDLARVTQTAARTRTLQFTLGGDDFDFHGTSPK